jgi:hypothetical protein
MNSIANPLRIVFAGCICLATAHASAQASAATPATPPPAPATYTGCVQKAPGSDTALIISTPNACARLTGKVSADDLAGHQIELKGILTPRTPSSSATMQVDSVVKVGSTCSDVCLLKPPGTRGLHPPDKAIPGSEGGTPGAVPTPPKE